MPFLAVHFHFFLNAVQSQAGTIVDVVYEWFALWVITKVGHNNTFRQKDTWEEAIHRWTDWFGFGLKF
jgi:hypothetical protein